MPALHGDGNGDRLLHRGDAFADQLRRAHQAGAERARLHAVGRTADIEVDLAVAERLADARRLRKLVRVGAAELQRDRLLERIEAEQPLALPVDHRVGNHHLGVKQRAPRQLAMQEPAMPVRPIHHRRDGKFICIFKHLQALSKDRLSQTGDSTAFSTA